MDPHESSLPTFEAAFQFAAAQARGIIERTPDLSPMYTVGGRWRHQGEAWTHWCEGFFPGILWLVHERTGDPWFRTQAERTTAALEPRQHDRTVHDLGFIFLSSTYRWLQAGGPPRLKEVLIQAGRTLSLRFQERGGYLASFIGPQSLFIDIMMNVALIFYAARETGDKHLFDVARRHSLTTRRTLVRGDGSTVHEGLFDLTTGEFLRAGTHQGFRSDSCWSRGLTWALYGFSTVYRDTRDPRFLETAERCADFYLEATPRDGIPPWDYDAPVERRGQRDSSAAAIAASGLFELAELTGCSARAQLYRDSALTILDTLCGDEYLAIQTPGWEGILKHGVYHMPKGLGVDESVIWGDHFFVEALSKALRVLAPA